MCFSHILTVKKASPVSALGCPIQALPDGAQLWALLENSAMICSEGKPAPTLTSQH